MLKNLINIITSPNEVFAAIKEKPSTWTPLLLILIVMAGTQFVVLNSIDFDYLINSMAEQAAEQQNVPVSEVRQNLSVLTPTILSISGVAGILIVLPIIFVITAAYLNLMAKLIDDRYRFAHMFSLVCWTSVPLIVTALASVLNIVLSSSKQFTETQFNPLSFASLFSLHDSPLSAMMSNLDLVTIWTSVLAILGFKFLTNSSGLKASLIVLAPSIIIYGAWAGFILL